MGSSNSIELNGFLEKLNIEIWNFTRCSHRASFQWTAITEFAYFVGGRTCGKGKGKELAPSTQTVRETFYTAGRLWNGVHVTTIKRCGRHCFLTPIFNSPRSSCVYFVKKWEAGSFLFRQANKFDFKVNRIKLKLIKRWIQILKISKNFQCQIFRWKKWHISPLRHRRRWSGEGVTWAAGRDLVQPLWRAPPPRCGQNEKWTHLHSPRHCALPLVANVSVPPFKN